MTHSSAHIESYVSHWLFLEPYSHPNIEVNMYFNNQSQSSRKSLNQPYGSSCLEFGQDLLCGKSKYLLPGLYSWAKDTPTNLSFVFMTSYMKLSKSCLGSFFRYRFLVKCSSPGSSLDFLILDYTFYNTSLLLFVSNYWFSEKIFTLVLACLG